MYKKRIVSVMLIFVFGFLSFAQGENINLKELKVKGPDMLSKQEPMSDEEFLDMVQKKAALFFWEEANPATGLIKDRASNFIKDEHNVASIASLGFGFTALIIAEKRGWLTKEEVYNRILKTLKYVENKLTHKEGFYFHFINMRSGMREWMSEISSIDTAIFIAGALFAGEYYKGTEVEKLADNLYRRINWQWMSNGRKFVSMGYRPETKSFLTSYWNVYNESLLLNVLAIGSPTFPISPDAWHDMDRPQGNYKGYECISSAPLFTHQYPHLWIDFRDKHDRIADYFENARAATLANRQYCIDRMGVYETYGPDSWGLTACDGPTGYNAFGALPGGFALDDGTVAPTAAGGSLMLTPQESISALKYMYYTYKTGIWGKYGFSDSYNVDNSYRSPDVIGIDLGAIVLAIENYRTGMVWEYFMRNTHIQNAMKKIGFQKKEKSGSIDLHGKWKFKQGNDILFKDINYDDKDWKEINVPSYWEKQGYPSYDGIGWYRLSFVIPENLKASWKDRQVVLHIGAIDDADITYFNGMKIGSMGTVNCQNENNGPLELESMDNNGDWETFEDRGGASIWVSQIRGIDKKAILMKFDLGSGTWVSMAKDMELDLNGLQKISFFYKYKGQPNALEVKLVDIDGTIFGNKQIINETTEWEECEVYMNQLYHWWGGDSELDLENIIRLDFSISRYSGGEGNLSIDNVQYFRTDALSAANEKRIYLIPNSEIKFGEENVLAIRVDDAVLDGGIYAFPVEITTLNNVQYKPLRIELPGTGK